MASAIRSFDLQIAEVHGYIVNINFGVHQHLQKRRGRIRRAIHDALAGGMPAAGQRLNHRHRPGWSGR